MSMEFLRRIEDASFPLAIHERADIECAAVLVAAGLLEASLPEPGDSSGRSGLILRITPTGRAELNKPREDRGGAAGAGRLGV